MDYKNINDYELVYRIRENSDSDATNLIIKKYEPIICSCAKKYISFLGRYGVEMDDLIQEGRIAVLKAIKGYEENKTVIFYTYVSICIERSLITYFRSLMRKKNSPLNYSITEDYLYNLSDDSYNLSNYVINNLEEKNILLWVKEKFDFLDSNIFELRYNGFSYKEIGMLLDVSTSFVDSRLCKIRKTLQRKKDKF